MIANYFRRLFSLLGSSVFLCCSVHSQTLAEQQKISRNMKIDEEFSDKLSAEQQSTKLQQVLANNDESLKRSKKRKSFPKKKRKRTKQQKAKAKKSEKLVQHRHQAAEDFILGSGENNYSTAANNCKEKQQFQWTLLSLFFSKDYGVKNRFEKRVWLDSFAVKLSTLRLHSN